ncbi:FK506-binding protein 5 isoform X1 [Brachypodium distachyon]|nr:FK506-binding protein 5 isoform X1 [Brachypodium distachyon]|eukprot:XP_014757635.1 FK506-binding protein 5 isoform X1 [Brachypodium distachyon]
MPRRRSSAGRMDAAIDHFTPMGYNKAQVRSVVNTLLKVYGTEDGKQPWALLEDNCYQVVQDVLFEKQEEEEKLQLQLLQEQEKQSEEEGGAQHLLQEEQHEEVEEDDEALQQEAAMQEAPLENNMTIVRVHTGLPSEAVSAVEEKEEVVPMTIDAPSHRATLQHPLPAVVGLTRRPCYGWISESESDSDYEEHFGNRQHEAPVPTPGGDRLCKKKRPSRWDVK